MKIRSFGNHPEKSLNVVMVRGQFDEPVAFLNKLKVLLVHDSIPKDEPVLCLFPENSFQRIPGLLVRTAHARKIAEDIQALIAQRNTNAIVAFSAMERYWSGGEVVRPTGYIVSANRMLIFPKRNCTDGDHDFLIRAIEADEQANRRTMIDYGETREVWQRLERLPDGGNLGSFARFATQGHRVEFRICADGARPSEREAMHAAILADGLQNESLTELANNRKAVFVTDPFFGRRVFMGYGGGMYEFDGLGGIIDWFRRKNLGRELRENRLRVHLAD
jgi:hypothetical protein